MGWEVDPKARVANLPVGVQQRIEILKNLADDSPVLILDEPTAVLTAEEFEDLARVLGELKGKGKIVILIAHKLSEVLAVADRVTVLRRGEVVRTATRSEVDAAMLAKWMVGSLPEELSSSAEVPSDEGFELVGAWVKGDRGEAAVAGIDLQVRRGEIVGLGGVDGNGQVELAEAVVGVRQLQNGTRRWKGGPVTDELRVAYIPQDRQGDGLALEMSIQDNMLITGVRRRNLARGQFLKGREIAAWARHLVDAFQIKTPNAALPVGSLSGGNQQKVVVSRSLDQTPDLLVCANPTRGLDIRATDFVHRQLVAAREAGAAVLLISTDLDELAAIATRTLFLSNGKLVAVEGEQSLVGGTP
ncbi:MAG: ATP-binding cassette domain-containing protein [Fimbriimonadales bacterium]